MNGDGAAGEFGYWEEVDALLGWWEAAGEPNEENGKEYVDLLCSLDAAEAGTKAVELENDEMETIRGRQQRGRENEEDLVFGGKFDARKGDLRPEVARAMASWRNVKDDRNRRRQAWQMARGRIMTQVFQTWHVSHEKQELSKAAYRAAMTTMSRTLAGETRKSELWARIVHKARKKHEKKRRKKKKKLKKLRQAEAREAQGDAASEPGGQRAELSGQFRT